MFHTRPIRLLGMLLSAGGICLSSLAAEQTNTFADKLAKLSGKPTVALLFANDKITVSGSAEAKLIPIKGKEAFVAGQGGEMATVISNQDIGVTGFNISGEKICSATTGSFSAWFSPLVEYEDNSKRHYLLSANMPDKAIYLYISGNSRLSLQFKQVVDGKPSWPVYQFDFKWAKNKQKFKVGKWYHVTVTWNAENVIIYINGVKRQKKAAIHKTKIDFKTIMLGAYGGQKSINGAMTNVAFFDQCLTPEDIKILAAQ